MESPDSLWQICLQYCATHIEAWCSKSAKDELYTLRPDMILSSQICDCLLAEFMRKGLPNIDRVLHIFADTQRTKVSRISFRDSDVSDFGFGWLMSHHPVEVNICGCRRLTNLSLEDINRHGNNLKILKVGDSKQIFHHVDAKCVENKEDDSDTDDNDDNRYYSQDRLIINAPKLLAFSVHGLDITDVAEMQVHDLVSIMLKPLVNLTFLDFSACHIKLEQMDCLVSLTKLTTLILYDVPIYDMKKAIQTLVQLKSLKALDLARSKENPVIYREPDSCLEALISSLPDLKHLDISGTNLAGFLRPSRPITHNALKCARIEDTANENPIASLENHYLEFLGLFGCAYDACGRQNIPARLVTGTANETQIITAIQAYVDRSELLIRALNNMFDIFRQGACQRHLVALKAIVAAMQRHRNDRNIQISGSASLFYVVKGPEKDSLSLVQKREIVSVILDAMEIHKDESTMLRNGCLTLCHVNIPKDLLFEYERIVRLLLKIVRVDQQDDFIQRIGIFLLNSLACQVEEREKVTVGNLGAIEVMLHIIQERLRRGVCDEVMEVAWSLMWNITDETAINSERFIDGDGMNFFLRCLKNFATNEELLRNMMGLLGNVAEVKYLRERLMHSQFIAKFSDLLESTSDGIEVSYNACGVLAHMLSDGPDAWTISSPTRISVQENMLRAIRRWNLKTKRHINYRSFEPIMRLISLSECPEAQHWAVWALCNLTKMQRVKYCPLLEKENGIPALESVVLNKNISSEVRELAEQVLERCDHFHRDPKYLSDIEDMDAN